MLILLATLPILVYVVGPLSLILEVQTKKRKQKRKPETQIWANHDLKMV